MPYFLTDGASAPSHSSAVGEEGVSERLHLIF
jgi:hypothetical protein